MPTDPTMHNPQKDPPHSHNGRDRERLAHARERMRVAQINLQRVIRRATSETPASTSRPAVEGQKMPAGLRKSGAARPARPRGPRPQKFEQTKEAMRKDIQDGRLTLEQLEDMLEKNLIARYGGVSRDTARKARNAVLSELNCRQIPTNDK